MPIHLITGNTNKLRELKALFPPELNLVTTKLDLDEIQSLNTKKIAQHKLIQAYKLIKQPVIVEDISAELDCLNGLPGPFVKYFEEKLGKGSLYKLSYEGATAVLRCTMGYFDGVTENIFEGIIKGTITSPRGAEGFGFDFVFIPDGYSNTFSELGVELKNTISHRYLAAKQMSEYLANLQ